MSILTKIEITTLAKDSSIKLLGNDFVDENIESCSYDLRIGTVFKEKRIISKNFNVNERYNIEIKPSEIVTMLTLEEVQLPNYVVGTVFAINSLSSTGFLILNPGHIDPGYIGPISICGINLSKETIRLGLGDKIFTIVFDKLNNNAEGYRNKNQALSRDKKEEIFFRDSASKLSVSFFDLVKENEYSPFLKSTINEVIKEKLKNFLIRAVKIIGVVLGIAISVITIAIAILEYSNKKEVKEKEKIINLQTDSIKSLQNYIRDVDLKRNRNANTTSQKDTNQ